ncbi:hypothetical protein AMECASPLE_005200 [Ameca splendens]|uniref:Uncharacterized protein n=1 Tax=Ameca splendens TaxID=208324 RepID=A0ABV0ZK64_9TELE
MRRNLPQQHNPDTSNTICCSTASKSPTSFSDRTATSMSAGKADTDPILMLIHPECFLSFSTIFITFPSIHLPTLSHVLVVSLFSVSFLIVCSQRWQSISASAFSCL